MKKTILFLVMAVALTTQTLFAQVPSYVPTNGLVGYWPFNGNANDESGFGNNGIVNGATLAIDRFGNTNSCYQLFTSSGAGGYIELSQIRPNNDFTISAWVNLDSYTPASVSTIISKYPADGSGYELNIDNVSSVRGIYGLVGPENVAENSVISNYNFGLNSWGHIVWSKEGTISKIYFNGTLIHQQLNVNPISTNDGPNFFGKSQWGGNQLRGRLDDVAVYDRALNQQEITALYNGVTYSDSCNAVSGSLTQGLVGYWPFCGNASDDSGNGNNGTVNGATLTNDRFGNSNSAYSFDGIDDGITLPGSVLPYNANSYSISFWCKLNIVSSHTDSWTVFDDRDNLGFDSKGRFIVNVNNSNDAWYQMSDAGPQVHTSNFSTTTWTNIICVYDNLNNQMILYKDGDFVSSVPCTSNWYLPGNRPLNIGRGESPVQFTPNSYYVEHWQGEIDDIGIWNRVLTPSEISQLYNQNQCFTNTTVTDTLVINVGQLSYTNPIAYANNIIIAPNPASTEININFNNITNLNGGTLKIINSLGQEVATTPITTSGTNSTMQLATWGGTGMYFVQIINPQGQIVDIKKIILQ